MLTAYPAGKGPSGILSGEELSGLVDEVRTDVLGNLIGTRHGDRPSIMVEAHMDEIGLMVKYVDENGFLRFIRIGGWFDQTLLNQRVIIHAPTGPSQVSSAVSRLMS